MPRVKQFILTPRHEEEYEFEVTRVVKTTQIEKITYTSDDNGNPLSQINEPDREITVDTNEGIVAVSLPSREPAAVEIVSTEEDPPPEEMKADVESFGSSRNLTDTMKIAQDQLNRGEGIGLSKMMQSQKPIRIPKAGEVKWADKKDD